jgi:hypothetical protein
MAFTALPLRRSIPAGIITFLLGYAATFGLTAGRADDVASIAVSGGAATATELGTLLGGPPPSWVVSGWLFFNAQFVPTGVPTPETTGGIAALASKNLLLEIGGLPLVLFAVVPILLFAAGYVVAVTGTTPGANGARNAGASVALGYLLPAVVGWLVFTVGIPRVQGVAAPNGVRAIFVCAGYALVFGGLGGKLAERGGKE